MQDMRSQSGPITHLYTYKGRPFVCCIFNGPKSFHNLNESRASSEENQGGKMSASKGRRDLREKMSRSSISISLWIRGTHLVKLFNFSAASLSSSVRNQNTQQEGSHRETRQAVNWEHTVSSYPSSKTTQRPPNPSHTPRRSLTKKLPELQWEGHCLAAGSS